MDSDGDKFRQAPIFADLADRMIVIDVAADKDSAEAYEALFEGFKAAHADDLVLVSDIKEIPNKKTILRFYEIKADVGVPLQVGYARMIKHSAFEADQGRQTFSSPRLAKIVKAGVAQTQGKSFLSALRAHTHPEIDPDLSRNSAALSTVLKADTLETIGGVEVTVRHLYPGGYSLVGGHRPSAEAIGKTTASDKFFHHGYHRYHTGFLEKFRDEKDFSMLEIGIEDANSVAFWLNYFPHAHLFGMDIGRRWRMPRVDVI